MTASQKVAEIRRFWRQSGKYRELVVGGEGGRKRHISKSPVFQGIDGIQKRACVAGNVAAVLLDDASRNHAGEHFFGGRRKGASHP